MARAECPQGRPLRLERKPKNERMTFTLRQEGEEFRIEAIERQ